MTAFKGMTIEEIGATLLHAEISPAAWDFIRAMRHAAANGVGFGEMQQYCEWEWGSKGGGGFGPDYFFEELEKKQRAIGRLKRRLKRARASLTVSESL